jgi:SWI/SNF-related matrix-associated actin-dependent regulator of chromatin subfamily D
VQNPHQTVHPHQLEAQRRAEQDRRERGRRVTNRPTDRNIPDGVEDICIGDGVVRYKALREIERKLDATMMRKKMDISDSVTRSQAPRYGTMRIWISNTAENQPWQSSGMDPDAFDFESDTQATYRVQIAGRLLEEDEDLGLSDSEEEEEKEVADPDAMEEDGDAAVSKPAKKSTKIPPPKPKMFSQFFKSIVVDFDRSQGLQPDNFVQIEWKRPESTNSASTAAQDAPFSQLEFERKGDENINVVINLQRFDQPERYRLSKPLSHVLDTDEEDRAGVMMGIWEYVKAKGLQQDDDERKITCDANLKACFGQDTVFFPFVPQLVAPHLHPLPPIQLQYTIRVDKAYIAPDADSGIPPSQPTVYDILVPLDDPVRPLINTLFRQKDNIETLQTIQKIDEDIALLMRAIAASKAKHQFFTSMAKDPVNFVKRWISSQRRDLEVILGEAPLGVGEDGAGEEWRLGGPNGVWGSDVARESVGLYLARREANLLKH